MPFICERCAAGEHCDRVSSWCDCQHRRNLPPLESITCPTCGLTSCHPEDVRNRYCGHCHRFHDDMERAEDRGVADCPS